MMKNQSPVAKLLLLSIALITSFYSTTSQAGRKSYPMMCKGGDNTAMQIHAHRGAVEVFLTFRKSAGSASAGLTEGTCAWMDRPIRRDEPNKIKLKFKGVDMKFFVDHRGGRDTIRWNIVGGNMKNVAKLQSFLTAIQRGTEFQLYVYGGAEWAWFVMTKFGP